MLGLTDKTDAEVLTRWHLIAPVPSVLGPGRRFADFLPPLPDLAAGQSALDVEPDFPDCGPNKNAAGQACGPTVGAWTGARRTIREAIDRAQRYAKTLRTRSTLTRAQLGEEEGVSETRVTQVLGLLRLDRTIVAHAADLGLDQPVPTMKDLIAISRLPSGRQQVERYVALCATLAGQRVGDAELPKQRGLQHLFRQARIWQEAIDAGRYRSVSELARAAGVCHARVGKVMDLLRLTPDVQQALDVEPDVLPPGITQKEAMRIARMTTAEEQRSALSRFRGTAHAAK
jgi:uncharacterized protein (DUF2384 family)